MIRPAPRRDDEPIRIVIADDNDVVRDGLRAHVMSQRGLAVIGEAADGEQACACARALRPDVLLLDLSMPGVGGLEAATRITADCPGVRIIVQTMHEERSYVAPLIRAGVAGYVLKRSAAETLVPAIDAVVAGRSYLDPAFTDDSDSHAATADASIAEVAPGEGGALTEREAELLRLVALGRSNHEIATTLGVSIAAVAQDRGRGMTKLGLHSRAGLARLATERGWLTDEGRARAPERERSA